MTTNITPTEALEKIKNLKPQYYTCASERTEIINKMVDIATQALAPQECDVEKCDYYKNGRCLITLDCPNGNNIVEITKDRLCKNNPNCYYKQLHSQQKTFTLEEIKDKINNLRIENTKIYTHKVIKSWNDNILECLLAEFEKEVK